MGKATSRHLRDSGLFVEPSGSKRSSSEKVEGSELGSSFGFQGSWGTDALEGSGSHAP